MQEAIGTKICAFIAGVDLSYCKLLEKSICELAEKEQSSTNDIRFHPLEVKVVGSIAYVNKLVLLAKPNRSSISDVVAVNGHEDNASFVFTTNMKRFSTLFEICAVDLGALADGAHLRPRGEERYCAVAAVVPTNTSNRLSGILLHRTWCGCEPGVDFTSVKETTSNDMESTRVLSASNKTT